MILRLVRMGSPVDPLSCIHISCFYPTCSCCGCCICRHLGGAGGQESAAGDVGSGRGVTAAPQCQPAGTAAGATGAAGGGGGSLRPILPPAALPA